MTAALEWGEWSAARPGRALPPGKTRCPLYRRLGGPRGRSGRAENLVPTGTVQPVAQSRYRLSYAAHRKLCMYVKIYSMYNNISYNKIINLYHCYEKFFHRIKYMIKEITFSMLTQKVLYFLVILIR